MAIENWNRLAFIPVSLSLGLSSRATNSAYPTHCASTAVPEFPSGEPRFSISWACPWFLVRKLFIVLISWGLRPCFDLNTQLFSQSLHKLTWPFPFCPQLWQPPYRLPVQAVLYFKPVFFSAAAPRPDIKGSKEFWSISVKQKHLREIWSESSSF